MVKITVLNDDNFAKYVSTENFSNHSTEEEKSFSCRDSQARPLKYRNEINDVKLKRQIIKIFNLIDSEKTGFISLGSIKLNVDQLFNLVKKNNMMDNIKKSFNYMTHDMEHVKLEQVKNYLKIEKQIPKKMLDKLIPEENLNDEIKFYKFFSMIIKASYLKLK